MQKDFIPTADGELIKWLEALKVNGPAVAANLGLTPAEIAQLQTLCTEYAAQIVLTYELRQTAKAAVTQKKSMRKTHLGPVRKMIKKMKASSNFTASAGANIGVLPPKKTENWDTYRPLIKVRAIEELIEIKFRKYGMDQMQFQGRPKNGEWQYIGTRSHSPFYFKPQDQAPGSIIEWEFTGRAIVNDEPVGVVSNPVRVVYAAK